MGVRTGYGHCFKDDYRTMTFPLPLAAFEEYMFVDDRPAYPLVGYFRLRFSGRLDRPALERAFDRALERHPLLRARVAEVGRQRYAWVPAEPSTPQLFWSPSGPTEDFPPMRPIDLRREPGLRVTVFADERASHLVLQVHHANGDALGTFVFIEDLLLAYAAELEGRAPQLPALAAEQLARRGRFGRSWLRWQGLRWLQLRGLTGVFQFWRHRPVPIVPHPARELQGPPPEGYPGVVTRWLDAAAFAELRREAKQSGATLNDLLVQRLFLSLAEFRTRHGWQDERAWTRLAIPMNLRPANEGPWPAANVVSMVFLDRCLRQVRDARGLLRGIGRQMRRIKRWRLGFTFVVVLEVLKAVMGGLALATSPQRCASSAVLSNLGILLPGWPRRDEQKRVVVGDVVLETLDVCPPTRPYTCATFTAFTYADRLGVTLYYEPDLFSRELAVEMLEGYVGGLARAGR
mgnify:FL=1